MYDANAQQDIIETRTLVNVFFRVNAQHQPCAAKMNSITLVVVPAVKFNVLEAPSGQLRKMSLTALPCANLDVNASPDTFDIMTEHASNRHNAMAVGPTNLLNHVEAIAVSLPVVGLTDQTGFAIIPVHLVVNAMMVLFEIGLETVFLKLPAQILTAP